MIKIVDYGLGNVLAFHNVYKRLNVPVGIATTAADVAEASKLILPGVGAFDHAMALLDGSGMRGALDSAVLKRRVPVLGICVGMQILARGSEEGTASGLGWVPGRVRNLRSAQPESLPLPHMGWNDVQPATGSKLFAGLEVGAQFYFLHSFFMQCDDPSDIAAVATYGFEFCCAVNVGNVYGVQFHPEKSHHFGRQLLKNFAEL